MPHSITSSICLTSLNRRLTLIEVQRLLSTSKNLCCCKHGQCNLLPVSFFRSLCCMYKRKRQFFLPRQFNCVHFYAKQKADAVTSSEYKRSIEVSSTFVCILSLLVEQIKWTDLSIRKFQSKGKQRLSRHKNRGQCLLCNFILQSKGTDDTKQVWDAFCLILGTLLSTA